MAYLARYGKQPLTVVGEMTVSELVTFVRAISAIVREENTPKEP